MKINSNNIDNVGQSTSKDKKIKASKGEIEQKTAEANSLDAQSAYGQAQVRLAKNSEKTNNSQKFLDDLAKKLSEDDKFKDIEIHSVLNNENNIKFLSYMAENKYRDKSLLSNITNFEFLLNPDFNANGMIRLLDALQSADTKTPWEDSKKNYIFPTLFETYRDVQLSDIVNSQSVKPDEAAEFIENLKSITTPVKDAEGEFNALDLIDAIDLIDIICSNDANYDELLERTKLLAGSGIYQSSGYSESSLYNRFVLQSSECDYDAIGFVALLSDELRTCAGIFKKYDFIPQFMAGGENLNPAEVAAFKKNVDLFEFLSEIDGNGKSLLRGLLEADEKANGGIGKSTLITRPDLNTESILECIGILGNIEIEIEGQGYNFISRADNEWLYDIVFSGNHDLNKVAQMASSLNSYGIKNYEEITRILENISNSPYKTVEDYMEAYLYFKNLTGNDGEKIFTETSKRTKCQGLQYAMSVNPSSVEASNFEMLLNLIKEGVVSRDIISFLQPTGTINQALVSDIDTLYNAYVSGIEPIDAFIPDVDNIEEGIKQSKVGDTFKVEGEDYIRIKTSDDESMLLGLSKENFYKLFPPIIRFGTLQNNIGNCWEVTGINTLLSDNKTRAKVLSMFSQDGNDIILTYPGSPESPIRFKDGVLPESEDKQYYSMGALGINMLEYGDGFNLQPYYIDYFHLTMNNRIKWAKTEEEKEKLIEKLQLGDKLIAENKDNIMFDFNADDIVTLFNGEYGSVQTNHRDGGLMQFLYDMCGFQKYTNEYIDEENIAQFEEDLTDPENFSKYMMSCTFNEDTKDLAQLRKNFAIRPHHGYRLIPGKIGSDGKIETFKIIDPHSILEIELSKEEIIQKGVQIIWAEK